MGRKKGSQQKPANTGKGKKTAKPKWSKSMSAYQGNWQGTGTTYKSCGHKGNVLVFARDGRELYGAGSGIIVDAKTRLVIDLAGSADTAETNRFNARTGAMNNADQTQLARQNAGADVAFRSDDSERADYNSEMGAANNLANTALNRNQVAASISSQGAHDNLAYTEAYNNAAHGAETSRQGRQRSGEQQVRNLVSDTINTLSASQKEALAADDAAMDDYVNTTLIPQLEARGMSKEEAAAAAADIRELIQGGGDTVDRATEDK